MNSRSTRWSRLVALGLPGVVAGSVRAGLLLAEAWRASGGRPATWVEIVAFIGQFAFVGAFAVCGVGALAAALQRWLRPGDERHWGGRAARCAAAGIIAVGLVPGTAALPICGLVMALVGWRCRGPLRVPRFLATWPQVCLFLALLGPVSGDPAPEPAGASGSNPDLLFLLVDTLRADHLGCYGYARDTSPTLDSLSASGVRFDRAYAQWTRTAPSHATIFSGRYPHDHGLIANGQVLRSDVPLLVEDLRAAGYRTAGFVTNPFLGRKYGFDRGFDVYVEPRDFSLAGVPVSGWWRRVRLVEGLDRWLGRDVVGQLSADWLVRADASRPLALFVQWIDPHMPYAPPPPILDEFDASYAGELQGRRAQIDAINDGELVLSSRDIEHMVARYDGEIRQVDARIGRLLNTWRRYRRGGLVVMTADHGENMAEHEEWFRHPSHVHDAVARVPLLLSGHGAVAPLPAQISILDPVMHRDLSAAIRTLLGIEASTGETGSVLLERIAQRSVAFFLGQGAPQARGRTELSGLAVVESADESMRRIAWVRGNWKLVRELEPSAQRWILHDLSSDPHELVDVRAEHPEVARNLERELQDWLESQDPAATDLLLDPTPLDQDALDPTTTRMLRALGYL